MKALFLLAPAFLLLFACGGSNEGPPPPAPYYGGYNSGDGSHGAAPADDNRAVLVIFRAGDYRTAVSECIRIAKDQRPGSAEDRTACTGIFPAGEYLLGNAQEAKEWIEAGCRSGGFDNPALYVAMVLALFYAEAQKTLTEDELKTGVQDLVSWGADACGVSRDAVAEEFQKHR